MLTAEQHDLYLLISRQFMLDGYPEVAKAVDLLLPNKETNKTREIMRMPQGVLNAIVNEALLNTVGRKRPHYETANATERSVSFIETVATTLQYGLPKYLKFGDLLSLVLTSKKIFAAFSGFIESEYWFSCREGAEFIYYKPQKLVHFSGLPSTIDSTRIRNIADLECDSTTLCASFSQLLSISCSESYNERVDMLPPTLTHLAFGSSFNRSVNNLPPFLTHLVFGSDFNLHVDYLPPTVIHLTFGEKFDQPINALPPTLQELQFGNNFNQNLPPLPGSLTKLVFGSHYNQPLPPPYPSHLIFLKFGVYFNHPLLDLPLSLKKLILGANFKDVIVLPEKLKYFETASDHQEHLPDLPDSLTTLGISYNAEYTEFPLGLKKLMLPDEFDHPIPNLPNLVRLVLGNGFNQPVDNLPATLNDLLFGDSFDQPVNRLPPNIHKIVFGYDFNQPVCNLPPFTKVLIFGWSFDHKVDELPHTLRFLKFKGKVECKVDCLPPSLRVLVFHDLACHANKLPMSLKVLVLKEFNIPLTTLPPSLTHLHIGPSYTHALNNLPSKLEYLSFPKICLLHSKLPPTLEDVSFADFEQDAWVQVSSSHFSNLRAFKCSLGTLQISKYKTANIVEFGDEGGEVILDWYYSKKQRGWSLEQLACEK